MPSGRKIRTVTRVGEIAVITLYRDELGGIFKLTNKYETMMTIIDILLNIGPSDGGPASISLALSTCTISALQSMLCITKT